MSKDYQLKILSHNSIYGSKIKEEAYGRSVETYYSIPEGGINKDTGFLVLIAGFGGKAESNVYCKMRSNFADQYNLVTVQCNYFGSEFMQSKDLKLRISKDKLKQFFTSEEIDLICKENGLDLSMLINLGEQKKQSVELDIQADLTEENLENFNDMGIMQALDNIIVLSSIMNILSKEGLKYNHNKVIFYGHSHGAYLCYLCNILSPKLISLIIDNSAWLNPVYLNTDRVLQTRKENVKNNIIFSYLARNILDKKLWNLNYLYKNINNTARIICYHGKEDELVSCQDKKNFCEKITNCFYNEIAYGDGKVFYSASHGDANFVELFKKVMKDNQLYLEKQETDKINKITLENNRNCYYVEYKNNLPYVTVVEKKLASQIEDLRNSLFLSEMKDFNEILVKCLDIIDAKSKKMDNKQKQVFNEAMKNLSFAMQDNDYLLVTDILKFEILPCLEDKN